MRLPRVDDFVRLVTDVPEHRLNRGSVGVVRSMWCSPSVAYEVEFHQVGYDYETRVLLNTDQVEVEEGPLFRPADEEQTLVSAQS